jgi:hypothetical protein
MKKILFLSALVILQVSLFGQYVQDALRYSQLYYQGTARSMAVGGALDALGGDFSVLSTNPGGLGLFRTNDFTASIEAYSQNAEALYNGTLTNTSKTMFDISNLGYVIAKPLGRGGRGWKYWQFGFGMNRLNNYNGSIVMKGENQEDSRMDVYIEQTLDMLDAGTGLENINDYDPFYLGPAWNAYLLDTVMIDNSLTLVSPVPKGGILQSQTITTKGSNNEFLLSTAANFNDVLYIGATLGIPYLRYNSEAVYEEYDVADTIDTFDYWNVIENLKTTGWGINLKIGAVIRPVDFIRIGVAFHTPTYYFSMKDTWSTLTNSSVFAYSEDSWVNSSVQSDVGEYKYHLTTPMRFIGSLGFVIKEFGFISGGYEYAGYNQAKFKANDYSFDSENQGIKDTYKGVGIIRAGTEWRISKISLRAGYTYYGSPYKNNLNDGKRQSFSGGIGYRGSNFSIDFAYVRSIMNEDYYLYSYSNTSLDPPIYIQTNASKNTFTSQNFVLSMKYFFTKK